jgi:ABC-type uncharacterized transport system involved in gliding motility auxiliary subunit
MKINRKTHLEIRLQNLLFSLLFLVAVGLVAWLSAKYSAQFDWTASHRHTLTDASRKVLDLLQGPVKVTAYARENQQGRELIRDLVERYSRYKQDLTLSFVNPDTQPDKVRDLGITVDGEMTVEYQGRTEKIQEAAEPSMTNALQRLATAKERHIVFLEGHGDRSPHGQANHDLSQFVDELERKGMTISMINLATMTAIPDNTDVLVIAGPRTNLLPGEIKLIQDYIAKGKNLWWLADPGDLHGLAPVAEQLGIKFLPGVVVDASTELLGIDDPTFAIVTDYPPNPVTANFREMTLFPTAAALNMVQGSAFEPEPLLSTLARSWTETGPIEGKIKFDLGQGERQGPLDIGYALTRQVTPAPARPPEEKDKKAGPAKTDPSKRPVAEKKSGEEFKPADSKQEDRKPFEQRVVVIGDGDFLSNAYLGNGGNLDLGLNISQWLSHGDALISIPSRIAPDRKLELSSVASSAIALGFLFFLPLILFGMGGYIWFQRRRR